MDLRYPVMQLWNFWKHRNAFLPRSGFIISLIYERHLNEALDVVYVCRICNVLCTLNLGSVSTRQTWICNLRSCFFFDVIFQPQIYRALPFTLFCF